MHFRLICGTLKCHGMLRDVARDAEAATLNAVNMFQAYHRAIAEILQHVAMNVRIGDAQPLMQTPCFALTSDSCTAKKSAKKEELLYVRLPQGTQIDTRFCSMQALGAGDTKSILRVYKAVFELASVPFELWVRCFVWLCNDGANVMTGTKTGVVGLLRSLQEEVTGQSYFGAMHANCHRANLPFKDALKEAHIFPDVLNDAPPRPAFPLGLLVL